MSSRPMPALSLAAVPGRRKATLELAPEIEKRGFAGIFGPSLGDNMSLMLAVAGCTETIPLGTSIVPIYTRHVADFAQSAAFLHEVSGGRFHFGVGVSHGPVHQRLGVEVGKPLTDTRRFVRELRETPRIGELPPIVLAALRDKMAVLSAEIAEGAVWANASRRHMTHSIGLLPSERIADGSFFLGNMIPTVVSDDAEAAKAVHRRTLTGYVSLPNYRNYWRSAGYEEEMDAVEAALPTGDADQIRAAMSDAWLADCTLFGTASQVRTGVEAWFDAGVPTPILVPSSAAGNQFKAFEEIFAAFE
ncbi:MAG: LLM class flavin-dependent oxidoreductase [Acidobacteriota bacterium]